MARRPLQVLRHALGYPVAYASAARARRRIARAPAEPAAALEFARTFRWRGGTHIEPTQATDEILWLLDLLRAKPPRAIVEIGVDEGGTLFLWSRVAARDARLVGVDLRPLGLLGRYSAWAYVRRGFGRAEQRIRLLIPRDSTSMQTVDEVRQALDGRPVDFLFIDGDHAYDGVKRDFELYAPLVRAGGLIAFHDIAEATAPGVVRLWSELRDRYETMERVALGQGQFGIGVIRVADPATTSAAAAPDGAPAA